MSELSRAAHGVLLAAFTGPVVPGWLAPAYARGLGGICLYGNNIAAGSDLADLSRTLRGLAPTAVLALDEEGGDVTRLHTLTGSPSVGAAALGQYDVEPATRAVAAGIGAELASAGIWLDLAPCADVNSDPRNPVIGTRSFGADPALVARHTVAFVDGLADAGVAACVKHFPGHGDTRTDSHHGLPTVPVSREVLEARELVPFREAVAARVATAMTSHVVLTAIDADHPATTSPAVLGGLLRDALGFTGVIVSDALDMAGATHGHDDGVTGAAVRSLAAGADLLCLGPQPDDEDGPRTLELTVAAILAAVEAGHLPRERLLEAADRVEALCRHWTGGAKPDRARRRPAFQPDRAHRRPGIQPTERTSGGHEDLITRGREVSARVADGILPEVPALPDALVIHLDTGSNPAVGATAWGLPWAAASSIRVSAQTLPGTLPADRPVVLVARRATADPVVWSWLRSQLATHERVWLVELGWPDPQLEELPRVIRTWGSSAASTAALAHRMEGGS